MSHYTTVVLAEPSLVSYWRMDETQGFIAADSKGSHEGLYVGGCVLNRNGFEFLGPSVYFDGTDSFVQVTSDPVFHPGFPGNGVPAPYSIEAWVQNAAVPKPTAFFAVIAGISGTILNSSGKGLPYTSLGLFLDNVAGVEANLNWHHYVETYDGTTYRTYRDGLLWSTNPLPLIDNRQGDYPFVIGGYGSDSNPLGLTIDPFFGVNPQFFNGYISNVAFYNQTLSSFQVLNHFLAAFISDPSPHAVSASVSVVFTASGDAIFRGVRGQAQATQLPAEVVRGQIDGMAYLTQVCVEVMRPYVAGSVNDFPVSAAATVVFTATAAGHPGRPGAATASAVFTAKAKGFHGLYRDAFASVVFSAHAVLTNVKTGAAGHVSVIFRARAKNLFLPVVFDDDYLGRFQAGQEVPLRVVVRDQHGSPSLPTTEAPVADVYNLDLRRHVEQVQLHRLRGSRLDSVYVHGLRLGATYSTGRHVAVFRSPSGGFVGYTTAVFELVPGGDPSGPVQAAHTFAVPGGDQVVAHLGSGDVAKGSRPRVS